MQKNYFDLTDRVAVVTGASGGLGVQMAKALASQNATIVVMARRQEKIDAVAKEIADEFGVPTAAVRVDITTRKSSSRPWRPSWTNSAASTSLVNNAGTGAVALPKKSTDAQFANGKWTSTCSAPSKMAREVAKQAMLPAGYGRIINIASMYGLVGNKALGSAPYHAAKGGVVNLTRALAGEWGKKGITVNAICPGYFYTDLTRSARQRVLPENARWMIPMELRGLKGKLDTAAIFLASPASTYVNGIMVPVDGGFTAI